MKLCLMLSDNQHRMKWRETREQSLEFGLIVFDLVSLALHGGRPNYARKKRREYHPVAFDRVNLNTVLEPEQQEAEDAADDVADEDESVGDVLLRPIKKLQHEEGNLSTRGQLYDHVDLSGRSL